VIDPKPGVIDPEKETGMALDLTDTTTGYLLGRLFYVLERTEERAIKGVRLSIRDRYYSIASTTPSAIYPHLMKLNNYHTAMIERDGWTVTVHTLIDQIVSGLQDFPAHLNLEDQGRFAVGYYHQREALNESN